jgi:16S rRNA (guanine527-N7)-methyltransferase
MSEADATSADEPEGAVAALFGDRADLARRFHGHLATTAVERGLIGPREVPRLWTRHILNCAALAELVAEGSSVVDVGSGAGLPGLAVAVARPDVRVTLVEPLQRRVDWLVEVLTDLGLSGVEVIRARAEEVRGTLTVDVATARAVAALPLLAGWCLPLVRPGGRLLAVKGRTAAEELLAAEADLRALGATSWTVRSAGVGILAEPTTVVDVVAGRRPPQRPQRAHRRGQPRAAGGRGRGPRGGRS